MIGQAPEATRARSEFSPTPPRPTTAELRPGATCAVFTTAPTPVITAQPNSEATLSGARLSIPTTELSCTTEYCA